MRFSFCIATSVIFSFTALAEPVPILNAGFEADFAQDGSFPVGPVTSWPAYDPFNLLPLAGNFTGVINPTGTDCFNQNDAPEGRNAAILFLTGSIGAGPIGLSQVLGAALEVNTTYTLTVEVGNIASCAGLPPFDQFFDLDGFPGYAVQLVANDVVVAEDFNTLAGLIPEGEFATSTVELIVGDEHLQEGGILEIRLINLNEEDTPENPGIEVDFDDVRLDAVANGETPCSPADMAVDGVLDFFDVQAFLGLFAAGDVSADFNNDGLFDFFDVQEFLNLFAAGCP
jgi:hapalindole H/12-epi-hapalindole U/12-epi-fischerindole U/hapalindole U synthase